MKSLHLVSRGGWWHYHRRRPTKYIDVEKRSLIRRALGTQDFAEAKLKAAQISIELDQRWQTALDRGESLATNDAACRYKAATNLQTDLGFEPKPTSTFSDQDLVDRLRQLLLSPREDLEQKAVLGLMEKPKLTLTETLDQFWAYIEDEWRKLSHDQIRVKRNGYDKAIRNFEKAIGSIAFFDIQRKDALSFRSWWLNRLNTKGLKAHTGIRFDQAQFD